MSKRKHPPKSPKDEQPSKLQQAFGPVALPLIGGGDDAKPSGPTPPGPPGEMVEAWLRAYLSSRYAVSGSRVRFEHTLNSWGIGGEAAGAELVGDFNRSCHSRKEWRYVEVLPQDLNFLGASPQNVGELIARLTDLVSHGFHAFTTLAETTFVIPSPKQATDWLCVDLRSYTWYTAQIVGTDNFHKIAITDVNADGISSDFLRDHKIKRDPNVIGKYISLNRLVAELGHYLSTGSDDVSS